MSAPISPLLLLLAVSSLSGSAAANDVVTSFEFTDLTGQFTLGTPPNEVTFTGGEAKSVMMFGLYHTGFNSWMVDEGDLGVVTFSTPAESVDLWFRDQLFVGSTLTVLDVNGNVITTVVGTPVWQNVVEGSAANPVGSITLQNVAGNGYAVIDDFTYCAVSLGSQYCSPAVPNSSGNPAVITATGSSVAMDDDLTLTATDLPANQFGYFLASETQGLVMNPGGSQGNLCLGGQIARFNAQIQNSGAGGMIQISVDLTQIPTSPPTAVVAGETWNFQAWFRDLNPNQTSNFTDGVSVVFN